MKKIVALIFSVFVLFLTLQGCKTEQKNLILNNASVNENGTVYVEGKAITFEGTVNIEVTDNEGNICFAGFTTTDAKEPSEYGTFKKDIVLSLYRKRRKNPFLQNRISISKYLSSKQCKKPRNAGLQKSIPG
jgi:hypothetical protein